MITYTSAQGSPEWLAERRGVITGSRFADCRSRLKSGAPSAACLAYAQDLARERLGGTSAPTFSNAAMRMGTEQEPFARMAYERAGGTFVIEAGFCCTDDRKFGVSVDGLIDDLGIYECKTMVSSATLFEAVVKGDISAYTDQCEGCMWLLQRDWVDLHLWVPDLPAFSKVIRITRNDDRIEGLEKDLVWFDGLVSEFESQLRKVVPTTAATTF
jgi:exodeoxyribonuclease (lambda-induced)